MAIILCTLLTSNTLASNLSADQVLVIYNSQIPDSLAVWNYYSTARPDVRGFDLNNPSLSPGTISYDSFVNDIRNPIRDHLTNQNLESNIVTFTLTKGIPHRVQDINDPTLGDHPQDAGDVFYYDHNATYATVDSELTLLWHDLETGENDGLMDSHADDILYNPYHSKTNSITDYSRTNINDPINNIAKYNASYYPYLWALKQNSSLSDAGNIYLTARLDGHTTGDIYGMIDRASNIVMDPYHCQIILDEGTRDLDDAQFTTRAKEPGYSGDDYEDTAALLAAAAWSALTYDHSTDFLIGLNSSIPDPNAVQTSGTLAVLATEGGNHSYESQLGYLNTWEGQLADGALFNSIESFNARQFGGNLPYGDQGQLADWIALGGTFALGSAWEPFAPTVPDNEWLIQNLFINELSFVEAAWSSLPFLSWQQIVLGDPLATVRLLSGDADGDKDVDGRDLLIWQRNFGLENSTLTDGDFNGDSIVDELDLNIWMQNFGTNFSDPNSPSFFECSTPCRNPPLLSYSPQPHC